MGYRRFALPDPGRRRRSLAKRVRPRLHCFQTMARSGGQYLAGDRFTAADLYVGSLLGFFTIGRRPAFERYWAQISARPACARAKALDDAMAGTPR